MTDRLLISKARITELEQFALASFPFEACALLLGKGLSVQKVIQMRNSDASALTFSIAPQDLLDAYENAARLGYQIVGIFHSHPGPADPSSTDIKYMEINPVVWLIYSITERVFKAHRLNGQEILPVPITSVK